MKGRVRGQSPPVLDWTWKLDEALEPWEMDSGNIISQAGCFKGTVMVYRKRLVGLE